MTNLTSTTNAVRFTELLMDLAHEVAMYIHSTNAGYEHDGHVGTHTHELIEDGEQITRKSIVTVSPGHLPTHVVSYIHGIIATAGEEFEAYVQPSQMEDTIEIEISFRTTAYNNPMKCGEMTPHQCEFFLTHASGCSTCKHSQKSI